MEKLTITVAYKFAKECKSVWRMDAEAADKTPLGQLCAASVYVGKDKHPTQPTRVTATYTIE
jgi:hypothetical protein